MNSPPNELSAIKPVKSKSKISITTHIHIEPRFNENYLFRLHCEQHWVRMKMRKKNLCNPKTPTFDENRNNKIYISRWKIRNSWGNVLKYLNQPKWLIKLPFVVDDVLPSQPQSRTTKRALHGPLQFTHNSPSSFPFWALTRSANPPEGNKITYNNRHRWWWWWRRRCEHCWEIQMNFHSIIESNWNDIIRCFGA